MKHRLITGIILGLAALFSIFLLPPIVFKIIMALIIVIAAVEWLNFLTIQSLIGKALLSIVFITLIALAWRYPRPVIYIAALFWLMACSFLLIPQRFLGFLKRTPASILLCFGLLLPTFAAACYLQYQNAALLCYLVVTTAIADSGAYFCGKKWGKRPLAKKISPNKTIEGFWGAMLFGSLCALLLVFILPFRHTHPLLYYLPIGLFAIVLAVMGDLFESLIKRLYQVKDSGSLLPGHGGILDRIDSLSAVIPLSTILWLGYVH